MNQPSSHKLAVNRHVCLVRQNSHPAYDSCIDQIRARLPLAPDGVAVLTMDTISGHTARLIAPRLKSDGEWVLLEQPGRLVCEDSADVPVMEGLWCIIRQQELRDADSEPLDTQHVW